MKEKTFLCFHKNFIFVSIHLYYKYTPLIFLANINKNYLPVQQEKDKCWHHEIGLEEGEIHLQDQDDQSSLHP